MSRATTKKMINYRLNLLLFHSFSLQVLRERSYDIELRESNKRKKKTETFPVDMSFITMRIKIIFISCHIASRLTSFRVSKQGLKAAMK